MWSWQHHFVTAPKATLI
jgi:quercetin dioxygenase-like cupin family protein